MRITLKSLYDSKIYSLILLSVLFLSYAGVFLNIQVSYATILSDSKVMIYYDSVEYKGGGDVSSVSILANASHINFQVNYEDDILNSTDYMLLGDIFIDVDRNLSTGYYRYAMGSDFRLDYDVFGIGISGIADVAYWNSTLFAFIEVYPIIMDVQSDYILLQVPLNQLGIDNETILDVRTAVRTRIIDRGDNTTTYSWNYKHNITLDGNGDDWEGIPPLFKDPTENFEEQSDVTEFYMCDNVTHLFQRFDVRGLMPHVTPSDIILGGEFRVYYDIDNATETGSYRGGLGADYYLWVKTPRTFSGEPTQSFAYLHKWDSSRQTWDWQNKIIITNSVFINSTFEFNIPISENYLNSTGLPIGIFIDRFNSEIYDNIPDEGPLTHTPPFVEIVETKVSDVRANVDSLQQLYFRARFNNGNYLSKGSLFVNSTEVSVNSTGWAIIDVSSKKVNKETWTVTGVNALGVRKFNQTIPNPSIIWDLIQINIPEGQKVNLGEELSNKYAQYAYDGKNFEGRILLNDTLTDKKIGRYNFKIIGIDEYKYDLSKFEPDNFYLIFDEVRILMSISDTRVDIGTIPILNIASSYLFDSEPFEGNISVVTTEEVFSVREHTYWVNMIMDDYGINQFTSNNVTCIWDQIIITDAGVSNTESNLGESEEVWFKAKYAYDNDVFGPDDGLLYVDWERCEWNDVEGKWTKTVTSNVEGIKVYFVTKIEDYKYDLILFQQKVDDISITSTRSGIEIPGFPRISILFGLVIIIIITHLRRHGSLMV